MIRGLTCATRRLHRRARDESGAMAVLFAILAVLLLSVAAMGVDLGNAMNRKQLTQNSADFAAIAAGNKLPDTGNATVQEVADYLNKNRTSTDGVTDCNPDALDASGNPKPVTVGMLTDGNDINGEVTFPTGTSRIRVVAPAARVQFGMANAMGIDDTCVQSVATARIASASIGMSPYYSTDACDQGPQVLKSDAGGPSIPFTVPTLHKDGESNSSVLSSTDPNPNPKSIALAAPTDPDGPTITLTGTNLGSTSVNMVGFFSSDQTAPEEQAPLSQTSTSLTVVVPNDVASYQDVWWIRVRNTAGVWSAKSEARPLLVGDVTLSCDPASVSGNFGSIDVPNGGNDLDDLEENIRDGLRPPTTLKPWSGTLPADNTCNTIPGGVISTDTVSRENTNCVQSVTGLKAGPAYDGYLKPPNGKLRAMDTLPSCQALGRPARGPYNENADVLSCFLRDNSLKLSDTVSYHGSDALFTQEIYKSPRFLLVPQLDHDPSGTKWMPIKGFVAGFITDQPTGASRQNLLVTGSTDNGLVVENPQKLRAIRVFFFSMDALPPPPDGVALQDYFGSGKKIVTLVD